MPNLSDERRLPVIGLLQAARVRQVRNTAHVRGRQDPHRTPSAGTRTAATGVAIPDDAVRRKPVAPTTRA